MMILSTFLHLLEIMVIMNHLKFIILIQKIYFAQNKYGELKKVYIFTTYDLHGGHREIQGHLREFATNRLMPIESTFLLG